MKKLFISVAVTLLGSTLLTAGPVSPKAARAIAERYFGSTALRSSSPVELSYTHRPASALRNASETQAYYYVFNRGTDEGFAIVAGDDRMYELLAYSDNGHFDMKKAPAHVQWWMSQYDAEIEYLLNSPWITEKAITPTSSNTLRNGEVAPLLEEEGIKWGQDAPYFDQCPKDPVTGLQTYTGCVATAIGQVMRFHKWPDKGVGSHTYKDQYYKEKGIEVERSATFGTAYEWDKMPGSGAKSKTPQGNAIAKFLSDVGIAVNMNYSSNASSAWEAHVVRALRENFKYKKNLQLLLRAKYDNATWEQLVRKELDERRPIFYCGAGTGGGHAFVCDGYKNDGTFHFNWGWGDSNTDGYYRLTLLVPGVGGIGAGTSGNFSLVQTIIANVVPDKNNENTTPIDLAPNMSMRAKVTTGKTLEINTSLLNQGTDGGHFFFYAVLKKGNETILKSTPYEIPKMELQEVYTFKETLDLTSVPDGEYTATVEYSLGSAEAELMKCETVLDEPSEAKIVVEGGKVQVNGYDVKAITLEVTEIKSQTGQFLSFTSNVIDVTVRNPSDREFFAPIRLYAFDQELVSAPRFVMHSPISRIGQEQIIYLKPGESTKVTFQGTIGVQINNKISFYLQTPEQNPDDPFTDFGFYRARLDNSNLQLIPGDYIAGKPSSGLLQGLTVMSVSSKNLVTIYSEAGQKAVGPTFQVMNRGREHRATRDGEVYGVIYAKHAPTGAYFMVDISSNSYKQDVLGRKEDKNTGKYTEGGSFEFTPEFVGKKEIAPYTGYEGVLVLRSLKKTGIGIGFGPDMYGDIEVPIRLVKNTSNNLVEPVLINSVTPNPASSVCTISNEQPIVSLTLFTMNGVQVLHQPVPSTETATLNVSSLNEGIYLLGVRSADGSVNTHRLIVKR